MPVWNPRRFFGIGGGPLERLKIFATGAPAIEFYNSQSTINRCVKRTVHVLKTIVPAIMAISLGAATIAGCHLPGKKSRVMERADRYFKAGEYDKAKIEYMNVLRLDRTNRTAIK